MNKVCLLPAIVFALSLGLLQSGAAQQAAAPAGEASAEPRTFISNAEIVQRIAKAEAAAKSGTRYDGGSMLSSGPFKVNLEYRPTAATNVSIHENEAELFVVLEGGGTMVVGGTLINPTRNGNNLQSPKSEGGVTRKLVKGDMVLVPKNTVHGVTQVDGRLVLASLHLPDSP